MSALIPRRMFRTRIWAIAFFCVGVVEGCSSTQPTVTSKPASPDHRVLRAIVENKPELAISLLRAGADPNTADCSPALYYAASSPHEMKVVVATLVKLGANVNARGIGGETPLDGACQAFFPEIVEYLVSHGANVNARTKYGDTPLHIAAGFKLLSDNSLTRNEIVRILIAHGAAINSMNAMGETPLDIAIEVGDASTIDLLKANGAIAACHQSAS